MKGMGESFLLSEEEPLTPNIDGVVALRNFRRRAHTAEHRRTLDLSMLVFISVRPDPLEEIRANLLILELRKKVMPMTLATF